MHQDKLTLARTMLENRILKANGKAFEDLFAEIMTLANRDFQRIKPWGDIGDRKNDGYIRKEATYYQVYAPENPVNKHLDAIKKMNEDLEGLIKAWSPVEKFYFVFNDKTLGIHPDADKEMQNLIKKYKLKDGGILTAKNIDEIFIKLDESSICKIVGFLPDPRVFLNLDYNVLDEVIEHIMRLPYQKNKQKIAYPDWSQKIHFNNLSKEFEEYLNEASQQLYQLENYLDHNPSQAEEIQKHVVSAYNEIIDNEQFKSTCVTGDNIFWELIEKCMPGKENCYLKPVIIILAKYFEACDIFEEPK